MALVHNRTVNFHAPKSYRPSCGQMMGIAKILAPGVGVLTMVLTKEGLKFCAKVGEVDFEVGQNPLLFWALP